ILSAREREYHHHRAAALWPQVADRPRRRQYNDRKRTDRLRCWGAGLLRDPVKPITLSADPALHKVVKFHDLNDGQFAVDTVFDIQHIVDENTRVRNAQPDGWKGREHLVASIPMPIWMALRMTWKVLGLSTQEQQAALKRFLMDPDNAKFRTKTGRL